MAYPKVNGVPLDQIFDPYISGTKAPITNYTVRISGVDVDLRDLFAPIYLGTSAPLTKYKVNNADLNTFFAKKGTAAYSLPINGKAYVEDSDTRGTVSVTFNILADGTWNVTTINPDRSPVEVIDDTGTWLPSGESASNWSVQMTNDGSGDVISHGGFTGHNIQSTTAATAKVLTANQNARQASDAITTGTRAQWSGSITIKLYRLGVLRSTTVILPQLVINGN